MNFKSKRLTLLKPSVLLVHDATANNRIIHHPASGHRLNQYITFHIITQVILAF